MGGQRSEGGKVIPRDRHNGRRLDSNCINGYRGQRTPLHRHSRLGGNTGVIAGTTQGPGVRPVTLFSSSNRGRITRGEESRMGSKALRAGVHKVPNQARPGVELLAAATTDGAKRKGAGRVELPVLPSTVGAPGANSGKSGTAVVAKVPAPDRPPGRTLRQRKTTKSKDGV